MEIEDHVCELAILEFLSKSDLFSVTPKDVRRHLEQHFGTSASVLILLPVLAPPRHNRPSFICLRNLELPAAVWPMQNWSRVRSIIERETCKA